MKPLDDLKVLTPEEQVARTLAQDARRVRWLSRLTVTTLLVAAMVCVALLIHYQMLYQSAANTDGVYRDQRNKSFVRGFDPQGNVFRHGEPATPEQDALVRALSMNSWVTFHLRITSLVGLVFAAAALATVMLIRASQRATLRQIQASLADISKQLAALQPPGSGPGVA